MTINARFIPYAFLDIDNYTDSIKNQTATHGDSLGYEGGDWKMYRMVVNTKGRRFLTIDRPVPA